MPKKPYFWGILGTFSTPYLYQYSLRPTLGEIHVKFKCKMTKFPLQRGEGRREGERERGRRQERGDVGRRMGEGKKEEKGGGR